MTLIQSLILGIIQGLTEFLPISSSAHLVLIPQLLGWQIPQSQVFPYDVLVQLGTLTAVIIYFWKDLWAIIKGFVKALINRLPFGSTDARLGWYLILATIPAGLAGILIKDKVEAAFNSASATAFFLLGTALLLVLAEVLGKRTRDLKSLNWFDALIVGLFQAISLFPGISRSGSTIAGGMFRKLDRPTAARFSFLMSVPVMLGAGLVSFKDALKVPGFTDFLPVILVGFLAALLVGYLAIHWLIGYLSKRSLYIFAIYCALLASFVLIMGAVNKDVSAKTGINQTEVTPTISTINTTAPLAITADSKDNPLMIAYTPSVSWLLPVISVCTDAIPGFFTVTRQVSAQALNTANESIQISWGYSGSPPPLAFELGEETLVVIVNASNPITSLPMNLVKSIFGGQNKTWGDVFTHCPDCFLTQPSSDFQLQSITSYAFSTYEEPQIHFVNSFMNGTQSLINTRVVVPSSTAMVTEVENDPTALGFVGHHFLNDKVKQVVVSEIDSSSLISPILVILQHEPTEFQRTWISCIQKIVTP